MFAGAKVFTIVDMDKGYWQVVLHPESRKLTCMAFVQGLSIPIACVGSGDPVRVLRLYTTKYTGYVLKHLLLRHLYNLPLPVLLCYAQALCSETSYCYCCVHCSAASRQLFSVSSGLSECSSECVSVSHCTVRCFIYCLCRR